MAGRVREEKGRPVETQKTLKITECVSGTERFVQSIARLLTNSAQVSGFLQYCHPDPRQAPSSIRHGRFWDLPTNLGVEFFRLQSNPVFYSRLVAFYMRFPLSTTYLHRLSTYPKFYPSPRSNRLLPYVVLYNVLETIYETNQAVCIGGSPWFFA
jgi:hypothetical protein